VSDFLAKRSVLLTGINMEKYTSGTEDFDAEKFSEFETVPSWSAPSSLAPRIDEKRLIRKIDFSILPILFCSYFLQFLDKVVYNVCLSPYYNLPLILTSVAPVCKRHGDPE
jgi:hypothetical protein